MLAGTQKTHKFLEVKDLLDYWTPPFFHAERSSRAWKDTSQPGTGQVAAGAEEPELSRRAPAGEERRAAVTPSTGPAAGFSTGTADSTGAAGT